MPALVVSIVSAPAEEESTAGEGVAWVGWPRGARTRGIATASP